MIKEKKITGTFCDSCGVELIDSGVRGNCGRFQEPYLKHGEIDLCYTCAGKIFYRDVVRKVPEEKLQEWIKSLKKAESSNPLGADLELVELDLKQSQEKYGWGKTNIETTGIDETVPVTCLNSLDEVSTNSQVRAEMTLSSFDEESQNMEIPAKTKSTMTFLSDL